MLLDDFNRQQANDRAAFEQWLDEEANRADDDYRTGHWHGFAGEPQQIRGNLDYDLGYAAGAREAQEGPGYHGEFF